MKAPEKIYLQVGENCPDDADFKELAEVTHSGKRIYKNDIEYVRKDIAESEREAFAIFCYDAGRWGGERDAKKLYEMFNSRKAQKE